MSIFEAHIPEDFLGRERLFNDLEKVMLVVNTAVTVQHMEIAERMLVNLGKTWKLNTKNYINPVYQAVWDKIFAKRNEFVAQDIDFSMEMKEIK